jgi:uncharacterized UBP type Zn finger protein
VWTWWAHTGRRGLAQGKEKVWVSEESVAALVDMGFNETVATKALEATNNDVALAIEVLT